MKTYIVRTTSTHEFVAMFDAQTPEDLASQVNEVCCPSDCSFAILPDDRLALFAFKPTHSDTSSILSNIGLSSDAREYLQSKDPVWTELDPDADHFGSLIDKLLATNPGRNHLNEILSSGNGISIRSPVTY
jgi:hypothetical protein